MTSGYGVATFIYRMSHVAPSTSLFNLYLPQTTCNILWHKIVQDEVVAPLADNCEFQHTNKASPKIVGCSHGVLHYHRSVAIRCCLCTIISYHILSFVAIGKDIISALSINAKAWGIGDALLTHNISTLPMIAPTHQYIQGAFETVERVGN